MSEPPLDPMSAVRAVAGIAAVPTILDVVCRITGMGFAAVARVTEDRWVVCGVRDAIAFGLTPGDELDVSTTICREVRHHREAVVIDDVAQDAAWCAHPTPALYRFQSYISVPIVLPDGSFFGTLCALDNAPREVSRPEVIGAFLLFAELIASHLDTAFRLAASERSLGEERAIAELREQFIAVLGHDLRNPLAAIAAGTRMLLREPARAPELVPLMERSIARMSTLIDDVLDFARGRLGGGIPIESGEAADVAPALVSVIEEARTTHPDRVIAFDCKIDAPFRCDPVRLAQLASNLIANAIAHGVPHASVEVTAVLGDGEFRLAVFNRGEPIPSDWMPHLFKPFVRAVTGSRREGLGLGLFISSEIARAHDGRIEVASTPSGTCFTFRMPARA